RQLRAEQDERVEQSLFYMDQSAEKLQRTIRDLLEVSRIERSLPVEKRWVSLSEVVEELRLEHLGWMEESRAQILTDFEVAEVYFSPPNLKSILANLLTNSIKYRSPERDPIISVSSHLREQWLCLSISDNGMGIDLERYGAKLFGMFNRFHNHVEGSGVGLYIVKKLVEECGGRLEVDSEEGRGTTFRIYLPLESEHSPTKARALGIQS
ncbi:MAG: HAMP domain-containing sensor histidine kinase, partial [Bacteroidota bacterium]